MIHLPFQKIKDQIKPFAPLSISSCTQSEYPHLAQLWSGVEYAPLSTSKDAPYCNKRATSEAIPVMFENGTIVR